MKAKRFSDQLEGWLKSDQPKTIVGLTEVFAEKSFAIVFLLLMSLPALPIPTGGVTHLFEIICMLLCLELLAGRRTVWLPKRWRKLSVPKPVLKRMLPFLMRRVRWFERYSKPRLEKMMGHHYALRIVSILILVFTLGAFLAPPFSGLDTLSALGVVVISLSLILEDFAMLIVGVVIGTAGITLALLLGAAITEAVRHLLQ